MCESKILDHVKRLKYKSDKKSLGYLYTFLKNDLYKILYTRVKDKELIPDLIQDTFVKLWNSRESIDENKSIKSFVFRIAINHLLDQIKRNKVEEKYSKLVIDTEREQSTDAPQTNLTEVVSKLPFDINIVFSMSKYGEMKYSEIAESLGISIKTVESRMSKALKFLRENLNYE